MASILKEPLLWLVILVAILIIVTPLIIVWVLISLPGPFGTIGLILIIVGWGVAAGYKEWIVEKHKEEKRSMRRS